VLDDVGRVLNWCAGRGSLVGDELAVAEGSLMLATMQRLLRSITRRHLAPAQAGSIGKLAGRRRRHAWAQSVQQLLDSASRSASASQFPHPQWEAPLLLRTNVVEACRPELLTIKNALTDEGQAVSAAALHQLKTFLTDPSGSPLFGTDPIIVRRAARHL
jgi:hypothetical protein